MIEKKFNKHIAVTPQSKERFEETRNTMERELKIRLSHDSTLNILIDGFESKRLKDGR